MNSGMSAFLGSSCGIIERIRSYFTLEPRDSLQVAASSSFLDMILEPLHEVYLAVMAFLPNLLAMLIIILMGVIFALVLKAIVVRVLRAVEFDSWSDRMGLTSFMRKGDLWTKPTETLGSLIYWLLVIIAFMAGLSALKIPAIDNLVAQFVLYIPGVLSAAIILVFGFIAIGFVGRAVLIATVNRGYHYARLLAQVVKVSLIVLILAMALEQLQVAPRIVLAAFSIVFGGMVLALAIAFGVGGIEAARRVIEKSSAEKDAEKEKKDDIEHI